MLSDETGKGDSLDSSVCLKGVNPDLEGRGKPLHICAFCGKAFLYMSKYRRHLKIHTGEKPFACLICNKEFSQKANLKTHMSTHYKVDT